jgi:DNA-binding MarR family transcriptional regulator
MEGENIDRTEELNDALHDIWFKYIRPGTAPDRFRNLTFMEIHIMSIAYKNPEMIMKDIIEYFQIPQSTLSSIVSSLEKKGLLKRVINRRDLRSYSLEPTEEGRQVLEEHRISDIQKAEQILSKLNNDEQNSLISLLNKIIKE